MYQAKTFQIEALEGLSEKQIEEHLKLYNGYVKNVNTLLERLTEDQQQSDKMGVEISELTRRMGFEFNGMRLHEYYFSQFEKSAGEKDALKKKLVEQFGSFEDWQDAFNAVAKMRGIGWVLLVEDEINGHCFNVWVSDHELGHLAGQKVLFAMDVWEHAFTVDYAPTERGKYIEAFWKNITWQKAEDQYQA